MVLGRRNSRPLRSPTIKLPWRNPRKPAVPGAVLYMLNGCSGRYWSSSGNRIPTCSGVRETRLTGCVAFGCPSSGAGSAKRCGALSRATRAVRQAAGVDVLRSRRRMALQKGAQAPQPTGPRDLDTRAARPGALAAARHASAWPHSLTGVEPRASVSARRPRQGRPAKRHGQPVEPPGEGERRPIVALIDRRSGVQSDIEGLVALHGEG
jgi:hypothetical protein